MYRDVLTRKQTWTGFDTEEADAFLAQSAADKKAARIAAKAADAEHEARAPQRRSPSSLELWTFGQVFTDWEDRHRDGVQESTMRDYGPALNDLRRALGGVLARSLSDEHFEAYKRAKLDGVDLPAAMSRQEARGVNRQTSAWTSRRIIREAIRRGVMAGPNPVDEVVRPPDPKREQKVLTEPEMRRLVENAGALEVRALVRCFCELTLRFSEATGLPIAAYDAKQRTVRIRQQTVEQREPKPLRTVIKDYAETPWGSARCACRRLWPRSSTPSSPARARSRTRMTCSSRTCAAAC